MLCCPGTLLTLLTSCLACPLAPPAQSPLTATLRPRPVPRGRMALSWPRLPPTNRGLHTSNRLARLGLDRQLSSVPHNINNINNNINNINNQCIVF